MHACRRLRETRREILTDPSPTASRLCCNHPRHTLIMLPSSVTRCNAASEVVVAGEPELNRDLGGKIEVIQGENRVGPSASSDHPAPPPPQCTAARPVAGPNSTKRCWGGTPRPMLVPCANYKTNAPFLPPFIIPAVLPRSNAVAITARKHGTATFAA